ncbi:MAG: sugar phosphate nucleotidyltransferase [Candidatus Binatia bacterium]
MKPASERPLWGIVLAAGEGTRTREFLAQLCGGRGIKQFCAVTGRRSMLQHTLDRVQQLIPRERIVVIVSTDHRAEVEAQLAAWPAENLILQPRNRDTAPGILLPLASISSRDPLANVAIFPSDHFIQQEGRFMRAVRRAVAEVERFPQDFVLLGMAPDKVEEGYGWIEPGTREGRRTTLSVQRFWEKPDLLTRRALFARGALWNTFVCVSWAPTVWHLVQQVAPDVAAAFAEIRQVIGTPAAAAVIERVYATLRSVNFSSGVCAPLVARLRVFPVPEVGWSDWGSPQRISDTLARLGKLDECLARLGHRENLDSTAFPLLYQRKPGVSLH